MAATLIEMPIYSVLAVGANGREFEVSNWMSGREAIRSVPAGANTGPGHGRWRIVCIHEGEAREVWPVRRAA